MTLTSSCKEAVDDLENQCPGQACTKIACLISMSNIVQQNIAVLAKE